MNTIFLPLIIIAGLSAILLLIALANVWALSPDKDYPVERYGKIGLTTREQLRIVGTVWLAPTALALAVWMVYL